MALLNIAISSRALFDMQKSNAIYESKGHNSYAQHQRQAETAILQPGPAFNLIEKLGKLRDKKGNQAVHIVLISRNSADTGLRVFNSIEHYALPIIRAAFTNGRPIYPYLGAFNSHLFLSGNEQDVRLALQAGYASGRLTRPCQLPSSVHQQPNDEIRIAFDGDAVLFSDEAEVIFQKQGIDAFMSAEKKRADIPLSKGPFSGFLHAIFQLQSQLDTSSYQLRTALITARSAPSHKRVIQTLRAWDIHIDEMCFCGGIEKSGFLSAFQPDIYFDDQIKHLNAQNIASAHVPNGICNEQNINESNRAT